MSPAFSTTETVGGSVNGNTYTIAAGAQPIAVRIEDDDLEFDDGFIDPPNNSTGGNNQLVAAPVTINGVDYGPAVAGGTPEDQVELEFAFTTTAGDTYFVVRINGVNVGLSGTTPPTAGQTFTIASTADGQDEPFANIPCFVAGTRILTPSGLVAVEDLSRGDLVETVDDGPRRLLRNLSTCLSATRLAASPELRPIVFAPGSAGNDAELMVSPQHRVLVSGWRAELLFGSEQVLVPAKALVNARNIRVAEPPGDVRYHHLLFDRHQLIFSEGAVTESLYPGSRIAQVQRAAFSELEAIFGAGAFTGEATSFVRPVIAMREARALCQGEHTRV